MRGHQKACGQGSGMAIFDKQSSERRDVQVRRPVISCGSGFVYTMSMNLSAKCLSPCTRRNKNSLPNVDKVMVMVSDCGKHPRKDFREQRNRSSLSHILFPSRSPPPLKNKSKGGKARIPSLANTTASFASVRIAPTNSISTDASKNGPPKRSISHSLHRRNRHVFASSHSPTKSHSATKLSSSSSSSPSKVRSSAKTAHVRKHHRRRNFALSDMDFEVLFAK